MELSLFKFLCSDLNLDENVKELIFKNGFDLGYQIKFSLDVT